MIYLLFSKPFSHQTFKDWVSEQGAPDYPVIYTYTTAIYNFWLQDHMPNKKSDKNSDFSFARL